MRKGVPVESRCGAERIRFRTPLIEPDRRFSRIRLSDKEYDRKGLHALAHGRLRVSVGSRISPRCWYRYASGKREVPAPGTLCFLHNHRRSRFVT